MLEFPLLLRHRVGTGGQTKASTWLGRFTMIVPTPYCILIYSNWALIISSLHYNDAWYVLYDSVDLIYKDMSIFIIIPISVSI